VEISLLLAEAVMHGEREAAFCGVMPLQAVVMLAQSVSRAPSMAALSTPCLLPYYPCAAAQPLKHTLLPLRPAHTHAHPLYQACAPSLSARRGSCVSWWPPTAVRT
jgi:hypothetical protein